MAGNDQGDRDQLQAQASEIADLRNLVEQNQTNSAQRSRLGNKPRNGEGKDGDSRHVKDGSKMYRYERIDGHWYRMELARA